MYNNTGALQLVVHSKVNLLCLAHEPGGVGCVGCHFEATHPGLVPRLILKSGNENTTFPVGKGLGT